MAFDYKKEYKEYYLPKSTPQIIEIPRMNYIAVRGKGDPNEEEGEYKRAISVLYTIAYTIKMSKMGEHRMDGYFDFVVPPLEGFWRQEGVQGVDLSNKSSFRWVSVIRLPDFVTREEFEWAKEEAKRKKKIDCSMSEFLTLEEGLCVQIMHNGPYDKEPYTVALMDKYIEEQGYENDFNDDRMHHEIYLSDVRKTSSEKLKTVIRHPIKKK